MCFLVNLNLKHYPCKCFVEYGMWLIIHAANTCAILYLEVQVSKKDKKGCSHNRSASRSHRSDGAFNVSLFTSGMIQERNTLTVHLHRTKCRSVTNKVQFPSLLVTLHVVTRSHHYDQPPLRADTTVVFM